MCLHFKYDYFDYETSNSSRHIWNNVRTKKILLSLFQLATPLNSQNPYDTNIHYEHSYINLFMHSNWHFWSIEYTKLRVLPLFQFDTWFLKSKHTELFSTELLERNSTMWKTCFSATQNSKNIHQLNMKIKYVTDVFLRFRTSSMKDYTFH